MDIRTQLLKYHEGKGEMTNHQLHRVIDYEPSEDEIAQASRYIRQSPNQFIPVSEDRALIAAKIIGGMGREIPHQPGSEELEPHIAWLQMESAIIESARIF
tara:strand:- start:331 stop:633 length:303 start_codon:yes stop_codon:yes gene_type:complete